MPLKTTATIEFATFTSLQTDLLRETAGEVRGHRNDIRVEWHTIEHFAFEDFDKCTANILHQRVDAAGEHAMHWGWLDEC